MRHSLPIALTATCLWLISLIPTTIAQARPTFTVSNLYDVPVGGRTTLGFSESVNFKVHNNTSLPWGRWKVKTASPEAFAPPFVSTMAGITDGWQFLPALSTWTLGDSHGCDFRYSALSAPNANPIRYYYAVPAAYPNPAKFHYTYRATWELWTEKDKDGNLIETFHDAVDVVYEWDIVATLLPQGSPAPPSVIFTNKTPQINLYIEGHDGPRPGEDGSVPTPKTVVKTQDIWRELGGQCVPSSVLADTGSLDVAISLGRKEFGGEEGLLRMQTDYPRPEFYRPTGIVSPALEGFGIAKSNGLRIQFYGPTELANVIDTSSTDQMFQLEFFHRDLTSVPDPVTGAYPTTGSPYATITIDRPSHNVFRLERDYGGTIHTTIYFYDVSTSTWTQTSDGGNRIENVLRTDPSANPDEFTDLKTIEDSTGKIFSKVLNTYKRFPFGVPPISSVEDYQGKDLTSTWTYHEDDLDTDNYGKLESEVTPSGFWSRYEYDEQDGLVKTVSQFLDAPLGALESASRVVETDYSPAGIPAPAKLITETLLGTVTSRTFILESEDPVTEDRVISERIALTPTAAYNDLADLLITETHYKKTGQFDEEVSFIKRPNGTVSIYGYSLDAFGNKITTVKTGEPNAGATDIVDGTVTVTTTNPQGFEITRTENDHQSGIVSLNTLATGIDTFGRVTELTYWPGTSEARIESVAFDCCEVTSRTDQTGIVTTFNQSGASSTETTLGITTTTTSEAYDNGTDSGIRQTVTRIGTDTSPIDLSIAETNLAGQAILITDARGQDTSITEMIDPGTGHTIRTTTFPDLGTRIETFYPDGSLFTVSGTAVYPREYEYGIDSSGEFTKEILLDGASKDEWVKTCTDLAGRTSRVERPLPETNRFSRTENFYNAAGHLVRTVAATKIDETGAVVDQSDEIVTLYEYNSLGRRTKVALDLDGDPLIESDPIDEDGIDLIAETTIAFTTRGAVDVERSTQKVWLTDNQDSPLTVNITDRAVHGLDTWTDSGGLVTHTHVSYPALPDGSWTETIAFPDNSTRNRGFVDGRLDSDTLKDSLDNQLLGTTYTHDPHGRLDSIVDARNGATTYTYYNDDQIHTITTPDPDNTATGTGKDPQITEFLYDNMGRRDIVRLADHTGGSPKEVDYDYFQTGDLKKVSGARTYTVDYTYTPQGRLNTLATPTGTTTWNYDPESGLLDKKVFPDTTDIDYTYTPGGRVETRTTERGITTTYGYNDAGQLSTISYAGGPVATPSTTYGYNRQSQLDSVIRDGVTHTLNYNEFGQLLDETISGGLYEKDVVINPDYDSLRRRNALDLSVGISTVSQSYTYDNASRLKSAAQGGKQGIYSYEPDSPWVNGITYEDGLAQRATITKTHDFLNRLSAVFNASTGSTALNQSHAYTYNDANQRTQADLATGDFWEYDYDGFGHLDSAKKRPDATGFYAGQQFEYIYDAIGNRTSAKIGGDSSGSPAGLDTITYTPKSGPASDPNQYDTVATPGVLHITGEADAAATVTVNTASTQRQGKFFSHDLAVSNTTSAIYETIDVEATLGTTEAVSRQELVPKASVTCLYDADGNLTSDGYRIFDWDAENRLIKVETIPGEAQAAAAPEYRVEFTYDYLGRRVRKQVFQKPAGSFILVRDRKCVYDGWNVIAEFEDDDELVRSYLWGLDLDGQNGGAPFGQGAGGVGGLLAMTRHAGPHAGTHFAAYDGNGNLTGLINAATGDRSARYDYDPFGNLIALTGPIAHENPIRFSTKYHDAEADLYYYGFRHYNPQQGRWLNRDPLGEVGSLNLYSFVGNSAIFRTDFLGLTWGDFGVGVGNSTIDVFRGIGDFVSGGVTRDVRGSIWGQRGRITNPLAYGSGRAVGVATLVVPLGQGGLSARSAYYALANVVGRRPALRLIGTQGAKGLAAFLPVGLTGTYLANLDPDECGEYSDLTLALKSLGSVIQIAPFGTVPRWFKVPSGALTKPAAPVQIEFDFVDGIRPVLFKGSAYNPSQLRPGEFQLHLPNLHDETLNWEQNLRELRRFTDRGIRIRELNPQELGGWLQRERNHLFYDLNFERTAGDQGVFWSAAP